jgi:hypothetical protein
LLFNELKAFPEILRLEDLPGIIGGFLKPLKEPKSESDFNN